VKFNSIRWRLPISYAAVALLATLALGAVLLATLRSTYTQRELEYMTGNAETIGAALEPTIEAGLPPMALRSLNSQLDNLSFLSQARVRLLDADGQPVATSLEPGAFDISVAAVSISPSVLLGGGDTALLSYRSFIAIRQEPRGQQDAWGQERVTLPDAMGGQELVFLQPFAAAGTPYGFDLGATSSAGAPRSDQVVRQPLQSSSGQLMGYVELSQGPAYGREVVGRVARVLAVAGTLAVALAAAAGWLMSRPMSAPIVALAGTTTRMAAGDLTARAQAGERSLDEIVLLATSFNEMADQVEETIVALRRFVSDAAHELQTPLTALRTNLELAAAEDGPDGRAFLERAQAQVDRLEKLASGLLDLSRIEASPAQDGARTDLAEVLRQACEAYASQAEQAGLTFVFDLPPDRQAAPLLVEGDAAQLRRVADNLVDNACKFTPEGGTVQVRLRATADGARGWAELVVEDTGIGIPADDLPHLFSRFHRGRNAAAYPGNGLGLAIVKAIAESHGGQVTAENTGRGARMTIKLPLLDLT